jgi:phospholipase D1/2
MAILSPNANVWRIEKADRFSVLIDGAAFFGAVRQAALRARRSIVIMGWDLDSRTRLVGASGETEDAYPAELAPFLNALVAERSALNVYLLLWDYSVLYAAERETFPLLSLQWRTSPRVNFCLDDQVPPGGSQHQKIVVVDGQVAFSGGLDLTGRRWDTPQHAIDNPGRIDPGGKPYRPFHDVQAVVDGDAAHALHEIARDRWRCVTAEELPDADPASDPWPQQVQADFENVEVGLSRTRPALGDPEEIREVEALFLDSIATAERALYVENQFFTSVPIAKSIARRMQERPALETLLIGPQNHESWIEARTMRNGRIRFMRTLAEAGVSDRVRLVYPHVEGARTSTDTMMHSKVMIIDDRFLRIGSANLNNRSMGTDTECDLAIEASSAEERARILDIRHRLLADHCGTTAEHAARFFMEGGGLIRASHELAGAGHSLRDVNDGEPDADVMALYVEGVADPERPVAAVAFADMELTGQAPRLTFGTVAKLAGALLLVVGLTLAWHFTSLSDFIRPATLEATMADLAASPSAPLYVIGGYVLGGLVAFPLVVLIAATAAAFGPTLGFTYAMLGSIASAIVTYGLGAWIGRQPLRSLLGPRLNRVRNGIARRGIFAITAIRLVPIAPFTIVNLVAGASSIRFVDYVAGTVLGLLPGMLLMSALGYQIYRFLVAPTAADLALLAGAALVWVAAVFGAHKLVVRVGNSGP